MPAGTEHWIEPVFDDALIRKYDTVGPRYTSYPTAPHFHDGFDAAEFGRAVGDAAGSGPREASLYFHLPFCRRVCYFCACNVTFTNDRSSGDRYAKTLAREMDLVKEHLPGETLVRQLHWGGGTPTFSPPETLELLIGLIRERFPFAAGGEIGVEVDPRETTARHLEVLARGGFNRISMGIQDFEESVQKAVNRVQPYEKTKETIDTARAQGFTSVNVDLIYGLPRQTMATFEDTVDRVIGIAPDRIALFNFAYLPEMVRHQRVLKPEELPAPSLKLAILKRATKKLTDAGYVFIGMDHFAKPDDDLAEALRNRTLYRNFQGYTTHAGLDLYSFGVSSISQVGPTYSQNFKDLASWTAAVDAGRHPTQRGIRLTDDDRLRRDVIFSLMCHFVLVKDEIGKRHGIDFDRAFADEMEELKPLETDGLIAIGADRIEVLPPGRLLVRNVAMVFDARLRQGAAHRYSRTV